MKRNKRITHADLVDMGFEYMGNYTESKGEYRLRIESKVSRYDFDIEVDLNTKKEQIIDININKVVRQEYVVND